METSKKLKSELSLCVCVCVLELSRRGKIKIIIGGFIQETFKLEEFKIYLEGDNSLTPKDRSSTCLLIRQDNTHNQHGLHFWVAIKIFYIHKA